MEERKQKKAQVLEGGSVNVKQSECNNLIPCNDTPNERS